VYEFPSKNQNRGADFELLGGLKKLRDVCLES
jgi:hypothetical protein